MDIVLVGIGGAMGSLARFQLGKMIAQKSNSVYPISTFIINISGAVLLGLLTGLKTGDNIYILLADGFLGAYTTFSTFMYEGFNLFYENEKKNSIVYILGTLILGIIGYAAGFGLSGIVFSRSL